MNTKTMPLVSWTLQGIAAAILLQTLFFKFSGAVESGQRMTLAAAADEIRSRLAGLFLRDASGGGGSGQRPCHGDDPRFAGDPHRNELIYLYEHFHADTGRGLGASHQPGWTSLVNLMLGATRT